MEDVGVVVEALVADGTSDLFLREDAWTIAMDQQVFGPDRLIVAAADRGGLVLAIAHTGMLDPVELGLSLCLEHLAGLPVTAEAAVIYTDEPVDWGPPPAELEFRFFMARKTAEEYGVHLVDWFLCDGDRELARSMRLAIDPGSHWWDVP